MEREREPVEEQEEEILDASQLLNLAETHLRLRNFSLSRQYSLELLSAAAVNRRHRAAATQILTVSDILSAVSSNPYSVLLIDSFSSDHNLIRTQFKKLSFILDPIKNSSPFAQQALDLINWAFNCLSDSAKKAGFDVELKRNMDGCVSYGDGFWTFCPYCFYVYEYDRVYEGCCLRCQNVGCRRVFHGVALKSLPKMELDKGRYFGCFGYFPMGFENGEEGGKEMGKFSSWSPIVGMFPAVRNEDVNVNDDVIEILDESDESESDAGIKEGSFEGNVGGGVPIVDSDRPRGTRRKSVALNARRKKRNSDGGTPGSGSVEKLFSDDDENLVEEFGLGGEMGDRGGGKGETVCDLNEGDMSFFEGDGEIFVGLESDDKQ